MADAIPTLETLLALVGPRLRAVGFAEAGSDDRGAYNWMRFRRHERHGTQRLTRMITIAHAGEDSAFLADSYLVARETYTQTPAGRELRRYGTAEEADGAVRELAAAVLGWVDA